MIKQFLGNQVEYCELARAIEELAKRTPATDPAELIAVWPELERRVVARVLADKQDDRTAPASAENPLLPADEQRLRNLAWEIGVSVDLQAVHVGAMRALAKLLRERGQRFDRRGAKRVVTSLRTQ